MVGFFRGTCGCFFHDSWPFLAPLNGGGVQLAILVGCLCQVSLWQLQHIASRLLPSRSGRDTNFWCR